MRILRSRWLRSLFFLIFILGLTIPWVHQAKAEIKPTLAILPFFIQRGEDPGRGAICPICKRVYGSGEILPGSQNALTRLFQQKMEAIGAFKVLPLEKMEEALAQRGKKEIEEKLIPSSTQLGKELSINFIMVGYLFRFEERIGSAIGATKPASVGFDVHLLRVRDGKMVWEGRFDETQKPLSENLFKIGSFFRRKASWLTAEELSSVGMDEMLKRLPGPKELEEMP